MARYYRRRRRHRRRPGLLLLAAGVLAVGVWWIALRNEVGEDVAAAQLAVGPGIPLTTTRPEFNVAHTSPQNVSEKGETPRPTRNDRPAGPTGQQVDALVAAGKLALERGDLITARTHLSEAMRLGIKEPQRSLVRADLTRIGNDTIFSPRILSGDPLVARYIIKPGDALGQIAKAHKVSAELLASINGIVDKNRVRAGQTIKILTGPFRAVVHKSDFTMDVYIGTTFVKHFKVGLGVDGGTPTGEWRVGTKLVNPTYYPPRGGAIISADEPKNPLGDRWIGLIGITGEAVGQQRYGIHGTIEPDTIGHSVSLGCVRMYNEDVESLYTYLIEKHSTVTVLE